MSEPRKDHIALRISQFSGKLASSPTKAKAHVKDSSSAYASLDASELDAELFELLRSQLRTAFKHFKPHVVANYGPEINAVLHAAIWKFTIHATESTVGQALLDLRYWNVGEKSEWMTPRQKMAYALLTIGVPWLQDRSATLRCWTQWIPLSDQFWKATEVISKWWKVASLLNFLLFLIQGKYQLPLERILSIRAVFRRPQGVRQVGFEYMDRELLWHGFAEFLFFILPLINFRRIKNFLARSFIPASSEGSSARRCPADFKECVVCGHWPVMPHEIGCKHVFCYYCIQSNYLADPAYTCPICGQSIDMENLIQPVRIRLETT